MPTPVHPAVRLVAAVQVAGSAVAAALALTAPVGWLSHGLVEALAVAGIFGGVGAWRGTPHGLRLSRWVQAVQVLRLQTDALTYVVGTGVLLNIGVTTGQLAVTAGFNAGVFLARRPVAAPYVGVNAAALACLAVMMWAPLIQPAPPAPRVEVLPT